MTLTSKDAYSASRLKKEEASLIEKGREISSLRIGDYGITFITLSGSDEEVPLINGELHIYTAYGGVGAGPKVGDYYVRDVRAGYSFVLPKRDDNYWGGAPPKPKAKQR